MNQGGKGAASEPPRVENKRDRRRGAAGRAAALRRAPSDSDCSGETASLSADSGDRAPRPTPLAPPRSGKTRSRRRGSEWEVLEGLKDGQRFEKRPDVFNGYLHKKRKWPLKGWHKRFFVVDGGILVYARSPTDVARGRLHGSVDVGLSVISAKARRRRIDIDADEFIYHLRAKTPEVFRTWLNVLKAHRLYRQHLLTFGARESVPKIHAPLDDLPVTDNSSHVSYYSEDSSDVSHSPSSKPSSPIPLSSFDSKLSDYVNKDHTSIYIWQQDIPSTGGLIPLNFENFDNNGDQNTDNTYDLKFDEKIYNQSMCSMKCIANRYVDIFKQHNNKSPISLNTTDMEKQITCTDLNTDSPKIIAQSPVARISKQVDLLKNNILVNQVIDKVESKKDINDHKVLTGKRTPFSHKSKRPTTTTCYFFSKKKHIEVNNSIMKKSKKCTNLVKYKNAYEEPPLKAEASKCMLLGKFKVFAKEIEHKAVKNRADSIGTQQRFREVACNVAVEKASDKVQVDVFKENKSSQSISDPNDVDKITEQLMVKIFHRCSSSKVRDVKFYVEQVIQDLYDVKLNQDIHPVKALFRNLLDYWLKNTNISRFKEGMTSDKSIGQSQNPPTKDANLSTYIVKMKSKDTQIHYVHNKCKTTDAATVTVNANFNSAHTTRHKVREIREIKYETEAKKNFTPRLDQTLRQSASFEKERHIQELERLLKSTVYMCEMDCKHNNKEKDIVITKKLIDNIGLHSEHKIHDIKSDEKPPIKNSSSSGEIPEIQDTIDRLIDDAAISPDIAKEFLGAYLDVLLQNSSRSTNSSFSSGYNKDSNEAVWCEVVGEAVIKKISKSISTIKVLNKKSHLDKPKPVTDKEKQIDPGQVYLKNMLEKVTSIFSKATNMNKDTLLQTKPNAESLNLKDSVQKTIKDELGRPVIKSKYDFIYENCEQNSLVIDLSKYYLEHISMLNDPAVKEVMSITIKLKEKQPSHGKENSTCLNFKFPDNTKPIKATNIENCENWVPLMTHNTPANNMSHKGDAQKITCNFGSKVHNIDPANFFSNISECSSKPNLILHDNDNFFDLPNSTETDFCKELLEDNITAAELHPCYIMSIKKGVQFQGKKNVNTKNEECNSPILDDKYPSASPAIDMAELSIFERPTPRVIDEKFLLLLLENLAYVSKTVVSMHKDINALYLKLKKRHEKGVKTMINLQGLSLLGKIYSEDACCKDDNDKTTQCEFIHDKTETRFETRNASTNTNINKIGEKSACSCTHTPIFKIVGLQTGANNYMGNRSLSEIHSKSSNKPIMAVTETNTADIKTAQQSTSIPDCFNALTVETAVNTAITTTFIKLPNKNSFPSKFHKDTTKKKRASYKVGEDFLKEISISPLNKVSNHSQTEKRLAFDKWQRNVKDYNMCQLFVGKKCGIKTSSSFSSSTAEVEMSDEIKTLYRCPSDPSFCSGLISPSTPTIRGPQAGFVSGTPGGRFQGWIIESGGPLESAGRELGQAQLSVQQLQRLLDALDMQHQHHHDTDVSLEGASPNVKKDRRKFALRKKKSNNKCASVELQAPHMDPSSSHTALSSLSALTAPPSPGGGACSASNSAASLPIAFLSTYLASTLVPCAAARPQSLPGAETLSTAQGPASISSLTPDHQLREDFTVLAKDLVASLKGVVSSLICERGRLRAALEAAEAAATPGGVAMAALRTNLTSALQQNSELRTRLSRIHDASDIAEIISVGNSETVTRQFQQSLSYSSSCVSASEFFDAEEHEDDDLKPDDVIPTDEAGVIELDGDSSSEAGSLSSEEGSASSDNSDGAMLSAEQVTLRHSAAGGRPASCWSRRTRLPAPRPSPGGPSLWNLLYKNIGKDLSQISMPVTINEPLNMLQRLCEELEYSELLDSAAACTNAIERCALIASFAVSAYAASAHRAASKPFNPLLAETYECVRDDRAFRFLAEQVSHHPPISACHAESPRWCFWQEARIKTKFWGKSMEFQPTGRVHVRLLTTGDHYTWNKVTTCVHNLFGGQRWVDQYGEMQIACLGTDIACKLNFVKASSWSHTRHEVRGAVTAGSAGARLRLAGRWSEALYAGEPPAARCLWRPGAMPPEHELYYGFTRFAMELNEIEPGMRDLLPHTDTRLRPDQRALEEGDVDSAESYKLSLEQAQRERRRESLQHQPAWFRKAVEDGEETWIFTGEYWKAREAGFSEHSAPRIW